MVKGREMVEERASRSTIELKELDERVREKCVHLVDGRSTIELKGDRKKHSRIRS